MNHDSNRVWGAEQRTSSVRSLRSFGLIVSLSLSASLAAAQSPRVVVSTTDDVPASAGIPFEVLDGDLVAVQAGQPVTPFFAGGHFQATCGFVPGDIDAFTHLPGSRPGSAGSRVFSLLSNEGGFLDGDILVLDTGGSGAVPIVTELGLVTALGAGSANIDVDALSYDDLGRILFSLSDNLAASALGSLSDGDILRLESGFTSVSLVLSEADVQTRFTAATGLSDPILDVQGLEWAGGEVWVAVQSPSSHDGSVIALEGVRRVVFDELDMGLGGGEIDALGGVRPGDEPPVCHMSPQAALPGDTMHIETRGRPGDVLVVLMAGNSGFVNFSQYPGFGGWYLAPLDPWLTALHSAHAFPYVMLDGAGRLTADWRLPVSTVFGNGPSGELGWSFQLLSLRRNGLSAPFRVQKL